MGIALRSWPVGHVVKCLVFAHPDDVAAVWAEQEAQLRRLFEACRATRHEFLLEIIASNRGEVGHDTVARVIERVYGLGVYPDWWKLEPTTDPAAWRTIEAAILAHDPRCRGVVLLGLSAPSDALIAGIEAAAAFPIVKGFAVGRTIFGEVAARWLAKRIGDEEAVAALGDNLRVLADAWRNARLKRAA